MSIFENITFMNEGEQAEEYKARKAKEAEDREDAEEERNERRYDTHVITTKDDKRDKIYVRPGYRASNCYTDYDMDKYDEDRKRLDKAREIYRKEYESRKNADKEKEKEKKRDLDHAERVANTALNYYNQDIDKYKRASVFTKKRAKRDLAASEKEYNKTLDNYDKTYKEYDKAFDNSDNFLKNREKVVDVTNRHIRRHPDQYKECGIFESVQFLNESSKNNIIQIISKLPDAKTSTPATKNDINDAEKELNLKFADDYREYLAEFGAILADGIELSGIAKSEYRNVVSITKKEWKLNKKVPHTMYVIENAGIDGIIIWQNANGRIFQTQPDTEPERIANSLAEYISNHTKKY